MQRFATEYGKEFGIEPFEKSKNNRGKVAIIGAGPAGLGCASELAKKDYDVTVFEKEKDAGGVLRWNIPEFRLPAEAIDYDLKNLSELGVNIKFNSTVDSTDAVINLLSEGYKAVFISTGLSEAFHLNMLNGYSNAPDYISFLRDIKTSKEKVDLKDKNVAIVGGGSVAIDSAVSAAALGAKRVYLISLEHLDELPADEDEINLARIMNIIFKAGSQLTGVISDDDKITGLNGIEIEWIEPDKFIPENAKQISGTEFRLNVDVVVQAIGTKPGKELTNFAAGLKTVGKGIVSVNDSFETNIPGVFAGGDVANGGATVVQAVGEGKKAAESIDNYFDRNA